MPTKAINSSILLLAALLLTPASAQQTQSQQVDDELRRSREGVQTQQTDLGRLDPRMLEPLDQFSRQLMEAGRYDEAHEVLDQAVQIIRVEQGLYANDQLPYLLRRVESYGNQRDWTEARALMDHMAWLINRPETLVNENLLKSLNSLVALHLWGVASDDTAMQRYHFARAERLGNLAVSVGKGLWGDADSRLSAMIYKQVVLKYQQAAIVDRGGPSGISLRRIGQSGMARSRSDTLMNFYYFGLRLLNAIRDVYVRQADPGVEGLALAEMYLGDWNVLFNNSDAAAQAYRRSNELLVQAGIDQADINQFFARPRMLPESEFIDNWDEAMASLNAVDSSNESVDYEGSSATTAASFSFKQWSSQFPQAMAPEPVTVPARDGETGYAMFSFSLIGLEEVSRWYRGRLKRSVSVPQGLQVLDRRFETAVDWMELEDMIRDFRFRPRLIDGVPQTANAVLTYQFAEQ